jgi:hypothetical protein
MTEVKMSIELPDVDEHEADAPEFVYPEQDHEGDNREQILNVTNDSDKTRADDPGLSPDNEDVLAEVLSQAERRDDSDVPEE